jgi:hypothetical protein
MGSVLSESGPDAKPDSRRHSGVGSHGPNDVAATPRSRARPPRIRPSAAWAQARTRPSRRKSASSELGAALIVQFPISPLSRIRAPAARARERMSDSQT